MPVIGTVAAPYVAPLVLVLHRLCIAAGVAHIVVAVIVLTVAVLLAVVSCIAVPGDTLMPVIASVAAPVTAPLVLVFYRLIAVRF